MSDAARPGIVHRLDRDTSGLMVVARNCETHEHLKQQFKDRTVTKTYIAVSHGVPRFDADTIKSRLRISASRFNRMEIADEGKEAVTHYGVTEAFGTYASLLEVRPHTGRMHQIRAHLASIGHPILCDPIYGHERHIRLSQITKSESADDPVVLARLALHACQLTFTHPGTGQNLSFQSPVPPELQRFVAVLKEHCPPERST